MSKPTLDDFIATVPTCIQNVPMAVVVDIFSQGQCDRLVVVSEQQCPVGVISLRRLMPQLLNANRHKVSLDEKQPLWTQTQQLVEPIATLPAAMSVEQFGAYLDAQEKQTNNGSEWALVDSEGKFLGLLDSERLLKLLALSPAVIAQPEPKLVEHKATSSPDAPDHRSGVAPDVLDSLVQLLERLPCLLMLQSSTGEVVMQNPAWRQHFGELSDPEAVRREVEVILETAQESQKSKLTHPSQNPFTSIDKPEANSTTSASSRCQLGTQPGTCVCVWQMQNGQERVWQFIKIPLQETEDWRQKTGDKEDLGDKEETKFIFSSAPLPLCPSAPSASFPLTSDLWLIWANDVTEKQQLASELVAKNADLIQLNRLKDEFLACISHELRTPLTTVLGLSTLLKDQTLGQLNERQARYVRLIHENGRHLMTVVNDILDLTRMETGQMELTLEPVKIAKVCARAIEQAQAIQPKSSTAEEASAEATSEHRFTLSIEPGLDTLVADELRLRQMLFHLLSNAFKFTEAGGEIGLRVGYWEGWIAFTVWDTGIGIPEPKQHLIFQKFQQLENPLTRQFEGTGLGLVLTRALARLHGGDVSFISKAGKGSSFTLLLPPHPPNKRAGGAAESLSGDFLRSELSNRGEQVKNLPPQNRRNRLVLVVEAAPKFIENLTEQLTNLGYWVVIARSGTEALEKARRLQPGAIFLNPLLPLLSGWDVLTLLKSDATTSQIPVLITSTQAEKDKAFSNQADEFLNLPVQPQSLQQVLARFCPKPAASHSSTPVAGSTETDTPLTILKLVNSHSSLPPHSPLEAGKPPYSSPFNYRVLEADDLDQAELLARIWQPDVALIDGVIPDPKAYLQQLSQHSALAALPLVTLDAATTEAANQIAELSVFPCLTPTPELATTTLFSVLQIASGMTWDHSVLVVDVANLPDLTSDSSPSLRIEWFQALIQYLHTAGLRGLMAHSWAEVMQQIRQQGIDLLLLSLGESKLYPSVLTALTALSQQDNLPPVLVLDQRLSQAELREKFHFDQEKAASTPAPYSYIGESIRHTRDQTDTTTQRATTTEQTTTDTAFDVAESLETDLSAIAAQILPHSLSMEELLDQIQQTLLCPRKIRD